MISKIKEWFQSPATVKQLSTELTNGMARLEALEAELLEKNQQLMEEKLANADKPNPKNSTEPWVEIKSSSVDPVKGLMIELDWNDAFVQYLKDNGIQGRDDETLVQKWVALLYENLINGLEEQAVENSDKIKVSDYV